MFYNNVLEQGSACVKSFVMTSPKPKGGAPEDAYRGTGGFAAGGGSRPRVLEASTVADVGLRIVENVGFAGLTMRRLADELGVALATLYGTVGSKEAILNLMVENLLSQLPTIEHQPGREREALVKVWTATHELLVAHPEVAQLASLQPIGTPGLFEMLEATLEALEAAGLDRAEAALAYQAIRSYALGFTLLRISRSGSKAGHEAARRQAMRELPVTRFPELTELAATLTSPMSTEQYVLGLERLLDGFLLAR